MKIEKNVILGILLVALCFLFLFNIKTRNNAEEPNVTITEEGVVNDSTVNDSVKKNFLLDSL